MRRLFPDPGEVDPVDAYGRLSRVGDRSRVRLNMIASIDGAGSFDGRSAGLGGPADEALFSTLRSLADGVLVGAAPCRPKALGLPCSMTQPDTGAGNGDCHRCRRSRWSPVVSTGLRLAVLPGGRAAPDHRHSRLGYKPRSGPCRRGG